MHELKFLGVFMLRRPLLNFAGAPIMQLGTWIELRWEEPKMEATGRYYSKDQALVALVIVETMFWK